MIEMCNPEVIEQSVNLKHGKIDESGNEFEGLTLIPRDEVKK